MIFYKSVLRSQIQGTHTVPGLVSTDIHTAVRWLSRIATRPSCIIEVHCEATALLNSKDHKKVSRTEQLIHSHWVEQDRLAKLYHHCRVRVLCDEEVAQLTLREEPCHV